MRSRALSFQASGTRRIEEAAPARTRRLISAPRSVDNPAVSRILVALWVLAVLASAGALIGVVPWAVAGAAGLVLSGAIVVFSYKDDPASFHRKVTMSDMRRTTVTVGVALAVIIAVVVLANH